jgi:hypothetical protein
MRTNKIDPLDGQIIHQPYKFEFDMKMSREELTELIKAGRKDNALRSFKRDMDFEMRNSVYDKKAGIYLKNLHYSLIQPVCYDWDKHKPEFIRIKVQKLNAVEKEYQRLMHQYEFFGILPNETPEKGMELEKRLESLLTQTYIALVPRQVKLFAIDEALVDLGYFFCCAWKPVKDELLYSTYDFVPLRTEQEEKTAWEVVPKGRGLPQDVVQTDANCAPSALAAYLNKTCEDVIKRCKHYQEKKRMPITPMLDLLKKYGKPHTSIKLKDKTTMPSKAFGTCQVGMAFVQFTGAWDGHWSQEYAHTHWIAYDHGKVYDVNALQFDGASGNWMAEKEWMSSIAPTLWSPKATGFYIKNILCPE